MKNLLSIVTLCLGLVLISAPGAHAGNTEMQVGDLSITNIWARATAPNAKTAAAYMKITNNGNTPEMITAVSTPVAKKAELHQTTMTDGVMKMEHAAHTMIKPGESLVMEPGGYHLMMMKVTEKLVAGETMTMTVTFKNAGPVIFEMDIKKK